MQGMRGKCHIAAWGKGLLIDLQQQWNKETFK